MDKRSVNETIDERILRLLGLEDVFDLDYDSYMLLLREAIAKGSFGKTKLSEEELAILANERKRVRGKKGRFSPKQKRASVSKTSAAIKFIKPSYIPTKKLLTAGKEPVQEVAKERPNLFKILESIQKSLDSIISLLIQEGKDRKKLDELNRKKRENERRKKREEGLEAGLKSILKVAQKIIEPIQSLFSRIKKFVVNVLLARAFNMFMDWVSDPKNQGKVKNIARFITNWWPAIAGAIVLFTTPFGRFVRTVVGTVAKLSLKLTRFAIPRLLSLIRANPLTSAVVLGAAAAGVGAYVSERNVEKKRKEINPEAVTPQQTAKTGKGPGPAQLMQESVLRGGIQAQRNGGPINVYQGFTQGIGSGFPGYKNGGSLFSGKVTHRTGKTVGGAGPDTQFLPVMGGGGVVLQKGETVLQVGARERMMKTTGIDPLSFNVGPKANQARNVSTSLSGYSQGGVVGQSKISPADYHALLAISSIEDDDPQGRSDVAQSIYNRLLAASKYGANFYQNKNTLKDLITASGQYEPTFTNRGDWLNITDKQTAAIALMNSAKGRKNKWNMQVALSILTDTEKALKNPGLQKASRSHVGGRAFFLAAPEDYQQRPGEKWRGQGSNFFFPSSLEGTAYDKERRNLAAPTPDMLLPPKPKSKPKPVAQPNLLERIAGFFLGSKPSYAKPERKQGGGIVGRGLSTRGVQAGFTGMGQEGFEAISRGENFRLGRWKPQILGRGAYSAPTMAPEGMGLFSSKGALRYAGATGSLGSRQTPGGVIRTIVPGGARRINFLEPQAAVAPKTFDKGKVLADKLMQGQYKNSPLANRLRSQLTSGVASTASQRMSPLLRGMGGLLRLGGKLLEVGNLPVIGDALFPEGTSSYDQLTGPNAYYNAPGYKPNKKQDGGLFSGLIKENTGLNIPGAGADRQGIYGQPGEYMLTKNFVDKVGADNLDRLVAMIDKNSSPAKKGKTIPGPPVRNASRGSSITLPAISQSSQSNMNSASEKNRDVPSFSTVSSVGYEIRKTNADIYGIV